MTPFNKLPYGFQIRIIQLAPIESLLVLQKANDYFRLLSDRADRTSVLTAKSLFTTDTLLLERRDQIGIYESLDILCLENVDRYPEILSLIYGPFTHLEISGFYPSQLLLGLIRPSVQTVRISGNIVPEDDDVILLLHNIFTCMSDHNMHFMIAGTILVDYLPSMRSLARQFMEARRRSGLRVAYIQVAYETKDIRSYLFEH